MQTRKAIKLPSGASCVIRKLCGMDFLNSKEIPQVFGEPSKESKSAAAVERGVAISRLALTRACSPLTMPDKRRLKIVEKELDELKPGEIAVEEMSDEDANAIITGVLELTNMTREAATTIAPFPEKQEATGGSSPAGEDLRADPGSGVANAAG